MKLLVFSDLHIHGYRDFARTLPSGRNSRLQHTLTVLSKLRLAAQETGSSHVLFGGDLFHKKGVLSVGMYQAVFEELAMYQRDHLKLVLVVGNHDQATLDGHTHAVKAFSAIEGVTVVDEPKHLKLLQKNRRGDETVDVWAVPYMEDPKEFKKALNGRPGSDVLLAHGAINGAVSGPVEYQPEEVLEVTDIPDDYGFRFFGHYHRRQKMAEKCWYIGSPLQHSRGEAGELEKGYLVYDTTTRKFKNVPLGLPEFVKLTWAERGKGWEREVKGQLVDVTVDPDEADLAEVAEKVLAAGADAVNPMALVKPPVEVQKRLEVDPSMSPQKLVEKYINEYAPGDLDKAELLARAKAYLEAVT